jgi:hypothetical protein
MLIPSGYLPTCHQTPGFLALSTCLFLIPVSVFLLPEGASEGDTFFARRILAFLPERRQRTFAFPLHRPDFFSDYAIVRDSSRKLEVLIDHQLLPLKWDQTWSQWRHLISASIEISADFIRTGKYRKRDGE